jgi:hypothetical protein
MLIFNTVSGLIPLKIFNGNNLITSNINLINFTGSGVTASVGEFNNLTITIGGGSGGTTPTGSLLLTASFSNPNLTFTKGDGSTFNVNLSTLVPTSSSYTLSSSYALNGGVTQLLAGPNIVLSPISGLGQVTVTANLSGSTIFNTATGSYGSFYDTTTQTNLVANIPRSMSFNNTDITNGVSISGSTSPFNTYIKTQNAGVYDIQFSAQLDKTDSGTDEIVIWLRKNGIDLTDTATAVTLTGNNAKNVAAWNWFVTSAANDYYQIIWLSADVNLRLLAEPISGTHPGIPSVILTVNRVDQFLSNTGSFSGSFNGSFTGSLLGTASYATNALSASFAPSTPAFPFTGSARITGSLGITGSANISNELIVSSSINIRGNSDTVGNNFISQNLSNTANLTLANNGISTFNFPTGGKVYIAGAVGAGETLLEIRRTTSTSGGFIFRSDNASNQALTTTNGAFNIYTVDNSNITLTPGTAAILLNTTVNNYNSLTSTGIQFRVGTQAASSLNRWLNFGHNTNYGQILQAVQNGSTPAIDRLTINPYGGITTLCGELPNSFVDVLVSSGTGLRVYRGGITNGISFKVGNAAGFGMLITHEDTTNTSGYANIQIIQGNNAVFSAGKTNSATLNNFYGNAYGTIDSYAMMVGVKYDYSANTTRGITFSATNTSTNANIIQSVHDGVGKPLSLNYYGGNVSIGNLISPTAKLHIRGESTGSILRIESNTSSSIFIIENNGSGSYNGTLNIGNITSTPAIENTLNIYPPFAGGTGEGGQILLAASGGLYTSASMLDTYQNQFRLLKGTNTGGSTVAYVVTDLHSGNTQFAGAVTASAYSGLPNDYLYVTRNTDQTIVSGTWANRDIIFNNIDVTKGIAYNIGTGLASLTGGKVYRITARLAWSAAAPYLLQYSCYTSADTQIGPTVEIVQSTNTSNNISDGTLDFIYAPGSNTDIKIRTTNNTSALSGEFIRGDLNTQLIIQQIA